MLNVDKEKKVDSLTFKVKEQAPGVVFVVGKGSIQR